MNDDQQHPTHNGDDNVRPITDAKSIMQNPAAAAAGVEQPPVLTSPHIQDPGVAKLLNGMPGLVGAIDQAVKATAGKPFAFMLMVFTPGIALHATNANPQMVQQAAAELVKSWEAGESEQTAGPGTAEGGAANDGGGAEPGAAG